MVQRVVYGVWEGKPLKLITHERGGGLCALPACDLIDREFLAQRLPSHKSQEELKVEK